ncbi:MAG: hypothetical protein WD598_02940 [Acidimicrobiia bacterium]
MTTIIGFGSPVSLHNVYAWSSRAWNTALGRPSYWAAPRTMIASGTRRSSSSAAAMTCTNVTP